MVRALRRTMAATILALSLAGPGYAIEVHGAGSTFVYPVMSKWAAAYAGADRILYMPIGSGAGILQIKAATVDFGASDMPLTPDELGKSGLAQFPLVIGGVVPVVNITGLTPGQLRFSGSVLADIYLGKITKWNDPRIARLNPGVRLPATTIKPAHRSDGSGTTFNWTHFLGQASPEWRTKVGDGTSVEWPVGYGDKGNDGVAAYVRATPNAIGYVEYAYAVQRKLTYAAVQNAAGKFVVPSVRSMQAAADTADWAHAKDFYLVLTNAPGADAYPITATTFVLMYRTPKDPQRSAAALRFFRSALEKGQGDALGLSYVPLPPALVARVSGYVTATIK